MSKITLEITGVAAELALGNYMPTDPTIMNNWEEFYHYHDLIHVSQLLSDYIDELTICVDQHTIFKGKIPAQAFRPQKSFCPVMVDRALYLRTECAEKATYTAEFEAENFDMNLLLFETQDYDLLFKVGGPFVQRVLYNRKAIQIEWKNAQPLANICVLCRFENGYLVPVYDAINKKEAHSSGTLN